MARLLLILSFLLFCTFIACNRKTISFKQYQPDGFARKENAGTIPSQGEAAIGKQRTPIEDKINNTKKIKSIKLNSETKTIEIKAFDKINNSVLKNKMTFEKKLIQKEEGKSTRNKKSLGWRIVGFFFLFLIASLLLAFALACFSLFIPIPQIFVLSCILLLGFVLFSVLSVLIYYAAFDTLF